MDPNGAHKNRVVKLIVNGVGALVFGIGAGWCVNVLAGGTSSAIFADYIGGIYLLCGVCGILFLVCGWTLIATLLRGDDDGSY
jgi:hypothetical protein